MAAGSRRRIQLLVSLLCLALGLLAGTEVSKTVEVSPMPLQEPPELAWDREWQLWRSREWLGRDARRASEKQAVERLPSSNYPIETKDVGGQSPTGRPPIDLPAPEPTAWERQSKAIDEALREGDYFFVSDREIQQGKSGRASLTVRILGNEELHSMGGIKGKVGLAMVAELLASGNGLTPKLLGTSSRMISEKMPTEWSWELAPSEAGDFTLVVVANVEIELENPAPKSIEVFKKIEYLHVPFGWKFSTRRFVATNWQFLVGSPLLGILVWFLAKVRRRKQPQIGFGT